MEIFYEGMWGTMCYHGNFFAHEDHAPANIDTAQVICRQLGYPNALQLSTKPLYGIGTGLVALEPWCDGNETRIEQCHHFGWQWYNDCSEGFHKVYPCNVADITYEPRCDHSDDIGAECAGEKVLFIALNDQSLESGQSAPLCKICVFSN